MTRLWLRLRSLLPLFAVVAAISPVVPATFAYDGHSTLAARSVGSGPARGFLEVSDAYSSSRAVQNFASPRPADFIFDSRSQRFIMGNNPLGHTGILRAGGIAESEAIVGGRIVRQDGGLMTSEWSGHFGPNWTPEIRQRFQSFMQQRGVNINHTPWE